MAEDERSIPDMINSGARLVGAGAGAALGTAIGGPAGAVIGALGSLVFPEAVDWATRALSSEQKRRVSIALYWMYNDVRSHTSSGRAVRPELVNPQSGENDIAKEICEGALCVARDAYEEKKLRHIGAAFANFAFTPDANPDDVHRGLNLAGKLTWRQLCILRQFEIMGTGSPWNCNKLIALTTQCPEFCSEIEELRTYLLLTRHNTFLQDVVCTDFGGRVSRLLSLDMIRDDALTDVKAILDTVIPDPYA